MTAWLRLLASMSGAAVGVAAFDWFYSRYRFARCCAESPVRRFSDRIEGHGGRVRHTLTAIVDNQAPPAAAATLDTTPPIQLQVPQGIDEPTLTEPMS